MKEHIRGNPQSNCIDGFHLFSQRSGTSNALDIAIYSMQNLVDVVWVDARQFLSIEDRRVACTQLEGPAFRDTKEFPVVLGAL